MKRFILLLALVTLGYGLKYWPEGDVTQRHDAAGTEDRETSVIASGSNEAEYDESGDSAGRLLQAFQQHESNLQIEGHGTVLKVLKDDTKGSPHQRFLLRTTTGQTLLVAHNIELAPRLVDIAEGDTVRFYGEYEWNDKGGVIHWTHHDPAGRHPGGWLEHRGQRYE